MFLSIDDTLDDLQSHGYVADRALATSVFLAVQLGKPLLLEGEAGVGKTEVAKVVAAILGTRLIRLQGYEGIDVSHAVYEWNYARQLMAIRVAEVVGETVNTPDVFGLEFLIKRPLLQALEGGSAGRPVVLLLDELDRVDDEFEAYLLEVLSDFQITIPEIGTITAQAKPIVIITSNRTRELHDALKRRCLYHWIPYPSFEKELAIVRVHLPDAGEALSRQIVKFVQGLREMDLYKLPGTAETLDWARALVALDARTVTTELVEHTLGVALKNQEDIERIQGRIAQELVRKAAG